MSKDHFYFSRNDRIVALVLLFVIIVAKVWLYMGLPELNPDQGIQSELPETIQVRNIHVNESSEKREYKKDSSNYTYKRFEYASKSTNSYKKQRSNVTASKQAPSSLIDLNTADSLLLISLPGIGPYYSSRIIRFREQLGGFFQISQLMEIKGLPDSLVKWFIITDTVPLRKIRVNDASLTELRKHPYLNFYQARAILEFRRERGNLKGPEQLSFMEEFTDQDLVRLLPYLDFR